MNWFPPWQQRLNPEEPDAEDVSIDDAIERAYSIAFYSLLDEVDADDISLEVAKQAYDVWSQNSPRSVRAHKPAKNRAFQIDLIAHNETEEYKRKWVDDRSRALDPETVDVWFMEAVASYILDHRSLHVAVGIANVIFAYENTQVQAVLERLDRSVLETAAKHKDADFRAAKGFILDYFKPKKRGNYKRSVGRFLKTEVRASHKNEVRFTTRTNSSADIEFVKRTLRHLTPLQPDCPFPHRFYDGEFDIGTEDLEAFVVKHDVYKTREGVDRVRIHVLFDPECWFQLYTKMRMGTPERKLEMPDYSSNDRVDPTGRPKMGRSNIARLSEEQKAKTKKRLERWVHDRKNFVAQSVRVEISGGGYVDVAMERGIKIPSGLLLEDGENVIKIIGHDGTRDLLLNTHLLSWDEIPRRTIKCVTRLSGRGKLILRVRYNKDSQPMTASIDIKFKSEVPWKSALTNTFTESASLSLRQVALILAGGFAAAFFLEKIVGKRLPKSFPVLTWESRILFLLILTVLSMHILNKDLLREETKTQALASLSKSSQPRDVPPSPDGRSSSDPDVQSESKIVEGSIDVSASRREATIRVKPIPKNRFRFQKSAASASRRKPMAKKLPEAAVLPKALKEILISSPSPGVLALGQTSEITAIHNTATSTAARRDSSSQPAIHGAVIGEPTRVAHLASPRTDSRASEEINDHQVYRPGPRKVSVNKGQILHLQTEDRLSSETTSQESRFRTSVIQPLLLNNEVIIPSGSIVEGRVSKIIVGKTSGERDAIVVRFVSLQIPNQKKQAIQGSLDRCPDQLVEERLPARLETGRKLALVSDEKKGTIVKPIPPEYGSDSTPIVGTGYAMQSWTLRRDTVTVVKPKTKVCLALEKTLLLSLP